jgi:hypothetical protein
MHGVLLGSGATSATELAAGCAALSVTIDGGNPTGTGGTGGASGIGGSASGGTGGSVSSRGGAGGSAAGTGGSAGARGGSGGAGPTNCAMGLTVPPGAALITDFSDAISDTQNPGEVRFGAISPVHGGSARYASTNKGTFTLSGGALTFGATVEAPTTSMMYPFSGFLLYFDGAACVNASAYQGVQFTLSNVTGQCPIVFKFTDSAHSSSNDDSNRGTCSGNCFGGAYLVSAGTVQIPFSTVPTYAGSPATLIDPAKLTDIQFQFQANGSAACTGSFTVDDIRFYGSSGGTGGTGGGGGAGGRGGAGGGAGGRGGGGGTGTGNTVGTGGTGNTVGTGGTGNTVGTAGTTGTGGATGTAGSTGAGGTTGTVCDSAFSVSSNGFVRAPAADGTCWHGYAYVGADSVGSTVTPASFASCGTPCTLTMMGTVAPATTTNSFAGFAYLGVNVNQDAASSTTGTLTPTGTGLIVSFAATTGGLPFRVQVGSSSTTWCYTVTGTSPVTIPWSSFNTMCWDGTGGAYAKQPISNIQLIVPGGQTATPGVSVTLNSFRTY